MGTIARQEILRLGRERFALKATCGGKQEGIALELTVLVDPREDDIRVGAQRMLSAHSEVFCAVLEFVWIGIGWVESETDVTAVESPAPKLGLNICRVRYIDLKER